MCTGIGFLSLWGLEPAPRALAKFKERERKREEKKAARLHAADPNGEVELKATATNGEKGETTAEVAPHTTV